MRRRGSRNGKRGGAAPSAAVRARGARARGGCGSGSAVGDGKRQWQHQATAAVRRVAAAVQASGGGASSSGKRQQQHGALVAAGPGRRQAWAHAREGAGRVRSNGRTTPRRMAVVRDATVARTERYELAGGEVLRAIYGNGKTARDRTI